MFKPMPFSSPFPAATTNSIPEFWMVSASSWLYTPEQKLRLQMDAPLASA